MEELDDIKAAGTVADLDQVWRRWRGVLHPDREGGDAGRFDAARKLYDKRYERLKGQEAKCPECSGAGKIEIGRGAGSLKRRCGACKGSGQRGGKGAGIRG